MLPYFHTQHFMIRRLNHSDLAAFCAYRAAPEIAKFQSWTDYSYQQGVKLLADTDYLSFAVPGKWYQLAIIGLNSSVLYGDLAVHFIDQQQVEIGFTVAPQFQGQGVACEALLALLDYLFSQLSIHRVIAITDTRNVAAWKLLEKVGFRREGHFHQNILFKGQWGDEYLYAMLSNTLLRLKEE